MKKIISLLLALVVICTGSIVVCANSVDVYEPLEPIEPKYQISCPSGGKHSMHPKGFGRVYSGTPSNYGENKGEYWLTQCSYCNVVLASEYRPYLSDTLGYYTLQECTDPIPVTGITIFLHGSGLSYFGGSLTQDSYWSGYTFYTH